MKQNVSLVEQSEEQKDRLGAVERSFALLERVAGGTSPATISNIIERLDLPKPTVYRMINASVSNGLLEKELGRRALTVGPRLIEFAFDVLRKAVEQAPRRAILTNLAQDVGETCNIGIQDRNEVIYIDRVEAKHWPLRLHFSVGSRVPMRSTAMGKIFLAYMPSRIQSEFLANLEGSSRLAMRDARGIKRFVSELKQIKSSGVAIDDEEFLVGVVCIAVPIVDKSGRIRAAVAVQAPSARMNPSTARKHLPALRRGATQLAASLEIDEA